jgi:hypothetical protein
VPVANGRYRRCGSQQGSALLESRELPGGGRPADARHYVAPDPSKDAHRDKSDHVDCGGSGAKRTNEWVTVSARAVLAAANRL